MPRGDRERERERESAQEQICFCLFPSIRTHISSVYCSADKKATLELGGEVDFPPRDTYNDCFFSIFLSSVASQPAQATSEVCFFFGCFMNLNLRRHSSPSRGEEPKVSSSPLSQTPSKQDGLLLIYSSIISPSSSLQRNEGSSSSSVSHRKSSVSCGARNTVPHSPPLMASRWRRCSLERGKKYRFLRTSPHRSHNPSPLEKRRPQKTP